jgi:hypothetical protein
LQVLALRKVLGLVLLRIQGGKLLDEVLLDQLELFLSIDISDLLFEIIVNECIWLNDILPD